MRVAIVLHLYYTEMWPEFRQHVQTVQNVVGPGAVDLFVSLIDNHHSRHHQAPQILQDFPSAEIDFVPNRGMDIGPFLQWVETINERGGWKYDAILKVHTKKSDLSVGEYNGSRWRGDLLHSLCGTEEAVHRALGHLSDRGTGMVGHDDSFRNSTVRNHYYIDVLRTWLGCEGGENFIAGTMFWIKPHVLLRWLKSGLCQAIYGHMPEGYCPDGTIAHAMERMFGYMVEACGMKIVPVSCGPRHCLPPSSFNC